MLKIIFVLSLFTFASCTESEVSETPPQTSTAVSSEPKAIQILAEDKVCENDNDCEGVMTHCSCDCGTGVNKKYAQKYRDQKQAMCADYKGAVCKMLCHGQLKCSTNKTCEFYREHR